MSARKCTEMQCDARQRWISYRVHGFFVYLVHARKAMLLHLLV
jgi:hypothetical protein